MPTSEVVFGRIISFEGGEGSGKSSLLSRLKDELLNKYSDKYLTRFSFEPGGSALGQEIRQSLIKPRDFVSPRAEALLYAAARAQHVDEVIQPTIESGTHIFLDRYVDASLAYQGVGRALGLKRIRELNDWALNGHYANRTYFFDIDPEIGLKRAKGRQSLDRIEQEDLSFHIKIRQAYQHLAQMAPERYVVVDASQTAAEVFSHVLTDLLAWLPINASVKK